MVQRKVPTKFGIKPYHLKSDAQLVNLRPSSPQTHEKLTKIMKKSRPIKRSDESRSLPPLKKKKIQVLPNNEPRSTPNYMKSTSCFDARKERSPPKTPSATKNLKTNGGLDSGHKGSIASSLKIKRSLTKTHSFKPTRPSKKVILCEDLDAQRATCSSTLKESKFPNYLQLSPGGTELEGTSAMKICPYTYCSLNGYRHAPAPPLKHFLSAKRRAIKTQKSFKLGCLSPRQTKPVVKTDDIKEIPEDVDIKRTSAMEEEEESRDFFLEINGSRDFERSADIDWEEGYYSENFKDDVHEEKIQKTVDKKLNGELEEFSFRNTVDEKLYGELEELYGELEELYDEESVTSGAWTDGDSESDSSCQQTSTNQRIEDQDITNFDVSSTATDADVNDKMDELQSIDFSNEDENIACSIDYWGEETWQEPKSIPEKSEYGNEKNRTTIIYNIIQFNISVFVNGEKAENSETHEGVKDVSESMEERGVVDDLDSEQLNANYLNEKQDYYVEEGNEVEINSINFKDDNVKESDLKSDCLRQKSDFTEEQPTRGKKREKEMDDSRELKLRGPNFLPEVADRDAESVGLKHQDMDERKNAEEWMVDFALQQAVTTLAPARKKKVALLVEAFENVMPIPPKYETRTTKRFTNARHMQACS